jgi:cell division control protein 6
LGKNGAGAVGEVRLVEGVWPDEILRGLPGLEEQLMDPSTTEEQVQFGKGRLLRGITYFN